MSVLSIFSRDKYKDEHINYNVFFSNDPMTMPEDCVFKPLGLIFVIKQLYSSKRMNQFKEESSSF